MPKKKEVSALSYVSRSVYQKVCEENKRLKADIYTLVKGKIFSSICVRMEWSKKFDEEKELANMLKQAAQKYLQENPEYAKFISGLKTKPNAKTK